MPTVIFAGSVPGIKQTVLEGFPPGLLRLQLGDEARQIQDGTQTSASDSLISEAV